MIENNRCITIRHSRIVHHSLLRSYWSSRYVRRWIRCTGHKIVHGSWRRNEMRFTTTSSTIWVQISSNSSERHYSDSREDKLNVLKSPRILSTKKYHLLLANNWTDKKRERLESHISMTRVCRFLVLVYCLEFLFVYSPRQRHFYWFRCKERNTIEQKIQSRVQFKFLEFNYVLNTLVIDAKAQIKQKDYIGFGANEHNFYYHSLIIWFLELSSIFP